MTWFQVLRVEPKSLWHIKNKPIDCNLIVSVALLMPTYYKVNHYPCSSVLTIQT